MKQLRTLLSSWEALLVVLEPRDYDDHVIKVPGALEVTAQEISPQGVKTVFSTWTVCTQLSPKS